MTGNEASSEQATQEHDVWERLLYAAALNKTTNYSLQEVAPEKTTNYSMAPDQPYNKDDFRFAEITPQEGKEPQLLGDRMFGQHIEKLKLFAKTFMGDEQDHITVFRREEDGTLKDFMQEREKAKDTGQGELYHNLTRGLFDPSKVAIGFSNEFMNKVDELIPDFKVAQVVRKDFADVHKTLNPGRGWVNNK